MKEWGISFLEIVPWRRTSSDDWARELERRMKRIMNEFGLEEGDITIK